MRLFFLIETLYKALGLVITMFQARLLGPGRLGEFQYYQSNVFGYLNSASLLSTDYKNLVAYQADAGYLHSPAFYETVAVKTVGVLAAWALLAAFSGQLSEFALWPYVLAIGFNLLQFDFLIYGHQIKTPFALVRLASQLLSLVLLAAFWQGWLDLRQFTLYQLVQTGTLNLGILVLVREHLRFDWARYARALQGLRPASFAELGRYFITNQFVSYVTTIEAVLLALHHLDGTKHVFTEGQRLAQVLAPWVVFYLNYHIGQAKPQLRSRLVQLVVVLILASPLSTALLYGRDYLDRIADYNGFLLMFLMVALLQAKNLDVLAADPGQNRRLARLNLGFFAVSTAFMYGLLALPLPVDAVIAAFLGKLLIYHWIYNRLFAQAEAWWFLPASLVGLGLLNLGLEASGYYGWLSQTVIATQDLLLSYLKTLG